MAYGNNNAAPRKRTVLDDPRLSMSAKCPTAEGKWSTLRYGYHKNQVQIVVWTNDPNDQKKKIEASLPPLDFYKYIQMLEAAVNADPATEFKAFLDIKDKQWIQAQNKRSDEPMLMATIVVGKKDGQIWQSLVSYENSRPKIKFTFGNTMYNAFRTASGDPLTDADTSKLIAMAHINWLRTTVAQITVAEYEHKERPAPGAEGGQRQGGGGSYNGGGGQRSGGYSNESSGGGSKSGGSGGGGGDMSDDDVPW